jgi:amino acid adenylation domain-containing protein/non-ribosomal peptide synthase protein (TIGR01720 family)
MSELSDRIAALSPEKLALVWSRLRGNDKHVFEEQSIPRNPATDPCPLSFAQQRLWFLNQLEPESPSYNVASPVRIAGALNLAALEQSFREIIRRHQILRTTIAAPEGQPVQVIAPLLLWELPMADLRGLPQIAREAEIRYRIREEGVQPFNLARGPLMRVRLLRLGEQEYLALLTLHHIVCDEWSSGVLFREVAAFYQAFSTGAPVPLPELSIQYSDFCRWQRQWLKGDVLERQLQYWKVRLSGAPVLELPTDRPRPSVQRFRGASQPFILSGNLSDSLQALSRQEEATLFMTLLAAFQALIHRYTGQCDICAGTPIANRNKKALEELIGFFANTLVLRNDLSGNPSFRELLGRVRRTALEAYAHQDLPFEKVVEALQPARVLSHSPLFQVMFALRNASAPSAAFAGLTMAPLDVSNGTAQFDLTLVMAHTGKELTGSLDYNLDLFDSATIARMREHWITLLEGIVADPEQKLSDLPWRTPAERHQLSVEWNDTDAEYSPNAVLHECVEAQAEQTPDAVSVAFEDAQWTYRTLNQYANRLAHHLQALGVGPEVRVAVYMEQSFEMTVALLGILKAGGAYLPLDPRSPKERLNFMLKDAQVALILTQESLLERVSEHRAHKICLDADWEMIARASEENPGGRVCPESSAYVIYTSGSTGRPKGVMISHRGICNRLRWMQDAYRLTQADHVLQKTSATFDVSVWEFFWPLSNGARLVLTQPDGNKDSAYLLKRIAEQEITRVHFVPAMLKVFLHEPGIESCRCLSQVVCSGEALSLDLQERFFDRLEANLHNLYGPTEASIDVTSWTCQPRVKYLTVPIGRPIANTQVYILDSDLQPVPIGVFGELYIGGVGLSQGYLNQPELTAQTFIPNPYGKDPGARLYKTGDITRYLADGNIVFLGRADRQVKIRGFRIELEEVEDRLGQHPSVRECRVLVRTDFSEEPTLVAYLVVDNQSAPSLSDLRGFMKETLPDYMVPSAFVMLDELPLTLNGKVDYQALPIPDRSRSGLEVAFTLPRSPVEELLAGLWAQVLGLKQVGVHDNFFELGGNSISSIQIVARANRAGLTLTPKQMFQHPTVAELASVAEPFSSIHGHEGSTTYRVPLTPVQHWFFEQDFENPHRIHQTVLLDPRQDLNPELLRKSVERVWEHHDALRLQFVREKSGWQQVHAGLENTALFTKLDLVAVPESEVESALESDGLGNSLNLSEGPLVRAVFLQAGAERTRRFAMVIHNLVIDEVSWRILLDDLQTVYRQLLQEKAIELPPKTASFEYWSNRLTEYAQSTALRQEFDYWLAQSGKAVATLPVDDTTGHLPAESSHYVHVALNVDETSILNRQVSTTYRVQIKEVLLTILAQTLARWTGRRSLFLEVMGNGRDSTRDRIDLSRTVGCFTTRFPIVLDLGEANTFEESLKTVKEQIRSVPDQGIGYGVLRYLSGQAEFAAALRALPQPEVSFNYLGDWEQVPSNSSLFDLVRVPTQPASLQAGRRHGLQISGHIAGGRLQLDWAFNRNVHSAAAIEDLAQNFLEALRTVIANCPAAKAGIYTPSDFPKARLTQKDLDRVIARIPQAKGVPTE